MLVSRGLLSVELCELASPVLFHIQCFLDGLRLAAALGIVTRLTHRVLIGRGVLPWGCLQENVGDGYLGLGLHDVGTALTLAELLPLFIVGVS